MQKITTFFMFSGKAEEAMNLYVSLFENASIKHLERYGAAGPGKEGTVVSAVMNIDGQHFMCIDSPIEHGFSFTPAISLFVNCKTEEETDRLFGKLSEDGIVLMPLDKYPFSPKFGWVQDRFGVTWQLNLEQGPLPV